MRRTIAHLEPGPHLPLTCGNDQDHDHRRGPGSSWIISKVLLAASSCLCTQDRHPLPAFPQGCGQEPSPRLPARGGERSTLRPGGVRLTPRLSPLSTEQNCPFPYRPLASGSVGNENHGASLAQEDHFSSSKVLPPNSLRLFDPPGAEIVIHLLCSILKGINRRNPK